MHAGYYYSPSLRIYIDDVPQDIFFINQELLDVASVELIRGSAGTLYGENSQAGVINIRSNIAENKVRANAIVHFGTLDRSAAVSASGALIKDYLYMKASFKSSRFYGQIKDTDRANQKSDTNESTLARASILYQPKQGGFFAGFDYYYDRTQAHDFFYLTDEEIKSKYHSFGTGEIPTINRIVSTYAAKFGYDWEKSKLINVFSVQDRTMPMTNFGSTWQENQRTFADELRFSHRYANGSSSLYGAYFSYADFRHQFLIDSSRQGDKNRLENLSFALFTDHKIMLPANLDLTLGIRYQYGHSHINFINMGNAASIPPSFSGNYDYHEFAPRAVLSWTLLDNHKFYVSGSRGFKAGSYPYAIFNSAYANAYKPEINYTAEVGYKGFFFDERILVNLDYFYIVTQNRQENMFDPTYNIAHIVNVGGITSQGVELETRYNFMQESFVALNFTYTNAKYTDKNAKDLQGNSLTNTPMLFIPEFMANFSFDARIFRYKDFKLFLNGSINFKSRIHFTSTYSQKSYALYNAGLRAEYKNLAFALIGQNLANEVYDSYGYMIGNANYHQIGRLRNIMFQVSAKI